MASTYHVEFKPTDTFSVLGLGTVYTGPCPREWSGLPRHDRRLIGTTVRVGERICRIRAVEQYLPTTPMWEGERIGLLLDELPAE